MLRLVEPSIEFGWGQHTDVPRWLLRVSSRLSGFDRLHKIYTAIGPCPTPAEFARRALQLLGITIAVDDFSAANIPAQGRTLFVANHPFGVLDSLIAIAVLGRARPDLRVLASSALGRIPELSGLVFGQEPRDEPNP